MREAQPIGVVVMNVRRLGARAGGKNCFWYCRNLSILVKAAIGSGWRKRVVANHMHLDAGLAQTSVFWPQAEISSFSKRAKRMLQQRRQVKSVSEPII
jgi:hypothetical protein